MYDLDVERFFYVCVVKRIGHIFRQCKSYLNFCVNSPLFYQLEQQRLLGGRRWTGFRTRRFTELMRGVGLEVPEESSGRRDSRVGSGSLVRYWGSLWFCSMRDSEGLGWPFDKTDHGRITERAGILSLLFSF